MKVILLSTRLVVLVALLAACAPQASLPAPTATALSEGVPVSDTTAGATAAMGQDPLAELGWIAFIVNEGERQDVWLIRPDGSGAVNLTGELPHASADAPAWSPDGSLIAFDGVGNSDTFDDLFLLTVNAEPEQRQLTNRPGPDCYPNFSPDGTQIVYRSERDNNSDLYVIGLDGEEVTRLTDHPLADYEPAWSPDGSQIAFVSGRTGNSEIFVMDADGSNLRQLTNLTGLDWRPTWSPDGNWIVFESWRNGNGDLYLMAGDGSQLQQLTDSPAEDGHPSFSPDGRYIVFHSQRNGEYQLFLLEVANPENQWLLASTSSPALLPTWSPVLTLPNELPES